jgi:hypothetical protein
MRRLLLWLKAFFHTDPDAVCEMSRGKGLYDDFHDYQDSTLGIPWHMAELTCKRCGKKFCI